MFTLESLPQSRSPVTLFMQFQRANGNTSLKVFSAMFQKKLVELSLERMSTSKCSPLQRLVHPTDLFALLERITACIETIRICLKCLKIALDVFVCLFLFPSLFCFSS